MLLSRKWRASVGGKLQMDLSYATIPTMDGKLFFPYREPHMPEHAKDRAIPSSHVNWKSQNQHTSQRPTFGTKTLWAKDS